MKQRFFRIITTFTLSLAPALLVPALAQTASSSGGVAATQPQVTLKVGDKAPPIVAAKWFKGEPETSFTPGHVYVIEFWATWCGPCIAAMPHLSELARAYKGKATFVGVDVKELSYGKNKNADYLTKVSNFVKNMGDGMDYAVAADVREGTMDKTWLASAGVFGIPMSFVIDQQGNISWMGHPALLDDVLPLIVAGRFDENVRKAFPAAQKEKYKKRNALRAELDSLTKAGDADRALAVVDALIAEPGSARPEYLIARYGLLKLKGGPAATDYAAELETRYKNDPLTLQAFAEALSKMNTKAEKELAVKMMEHSVARCAPDDASAYSSMAAIYFSNGDLKKAVTAQEKTVAILTDISFVEQKQHVIDKAKADLKKYQSAR